MNNQNRYYILLFIILGIGLISYVTLVPNFSRTEFNTEVIENLEGKFLFVLGDNFFGENPLSTISSNDLLNNNGCQIYTVEVENPTEYGVAIVDNYSNVIEIEEKPLDPKSDLAVVGIYLFDCNAFEYIDELQPSARGEYEITDLINIYIKKEICTNSELSSWWIDAGTPDRIEELESKLL